jgi:hypothetical protein
MEMAFLEQYQTPFVVTHEFRYLRTAMKLCASVVRTVVSTETVRGQVSEMKTRAGRFRHWLCSLHEHLVESQRREDRATAATCPKGIVSRELTFVSILHYAIVL